MVTNFGGAKGGGANLTKFGREVLAHYRGMMAAVDEALVCKETNQAKCIVFNLSGHGHFDLAAYDSYLSGRMVDEVVSDERFAEGLATVPSVG